MVIRRLITTKRMAYLKVVNKPAGYSLDTTVELTKMLATLKCRPFIVIHIVLLNV